MITDDDRKTLLTCDGKGKAAKAVVLSKLEDRIEELERELKGRSH